VTHDDALVETVKKNWREAGLDPQTRALLEFAEKLTSSPHAMSEGEVQTLRATGLSDEQILDATLIVSLFNFMNRLTHALGLTGEEAHRSHQRVLPSQEA
jgi:uncharacterized peroxidase-related enzyme